MHSYDVVMIVILLGAIILGAWKGMAWQIASLCSITVSYWVALNCSSFLAPYLGSEAPWNRFAAMLVLYLSTAAVVWLLFRVVAGFIDRLKLKDFDRQVGALFGAAKGVVLCVAVTFFAVTLSATARDLVLKSRSGQYIAALINTATPIMPEEVSDVLGPYLDRLNNELTRGLSSPKDSGGQPAGDAEEQRVETVTRELVPVPRIRR